jgi:hypothetical protein
MWPVPYQGKKATISPQNFLFSRVQLIVIGWQRSRSDVTNSTILPPRIPRMRFKLRRVTLSPTYDAIGLLLSGFVYTLTFGAHVLLSRKIRSFKVF